MLDLTYAHNLTGSIVEKALLIKPRNLNAGALFGTHDMPTESVRVKLEMNVHSLSKDGGGRASPGVIKKEHVFADLDLVAEPFSTGESFNFKDFVNYKDSGKVIGFQQNVADYPYLLDEQKAAELLVKGIFTPGTYSGYPGNSPGNFFGTHQNIPGQSQTFSNLLDVGLTALDPSAWVPATVRRQVGQALAKIRTVSLLNGAMLDVFEPTQIWCATVAEQPMRDALEADFISLNSGSSDVRGWKSRYPVEIVASPYVDMMIAAYSAQLTAAGIANPMALAFIGCKPINQIGGLITGTHVPFTMYSSLPGLNTGTGIQEWSMQLMGQVAYAYGLPHFLYAVK